MFEVKQKRGINYKVTHNHPLYIERRPRMGNKPDSIELMTPIEYQSLSKYNKRTTYGLQAGIINVENDIYKNFKLDPYYFGL